MQAMSVLRCVGIGLFAAAVPALALALDTIPAGRCVARDAAGTVSLPAQCRLASGSGAVLRAVTGLPPGSELQSTFRIDVFSDIVTSPDGSTGGEVQQSNARLTLHVSGTGSLTGFRRTITVPVHLVTRSGPRSPGALVQSFSHNVDQLQGEITGDPDFDLLRIVAGSGFGMPSPGHTTLTRLANRSWEADTSFDLSYALQFTGAPGGALAGMSGTTTGFVVNAKTSALDFITAPPNALGSANVPGGGRVIAPGGATMNMLNGLPTGSPVRFTPTMDQFQLISIGSGSLGGPRYRQSCLTTLVARGEGTFSGYTRTFSFPHALDTDMSAIPSSPDFQSLENAVHQMQMQITGDPDFDLLRITAGNAFGLPSPGHTTLTKLPSGSWSVDTFFDLTYRIDFVGHTPGPFAGRSGSTTATIRMTQGGIVPRVYVRAFGLPHTALGTASVVSCRGSVCQDPNGVFVSDPNEFFWNDPNQTLRIVGEDPNDLGIDPNNSMQTELGAGAQGWTGSLDYSQQGTLSTLLDLLVTAVFPGSPTVRVMGPDPNVAIDPNEPDRVSLLYQPPGGTPPPLLQADLMLHGALMDSKIYQYPYPSSIASGTYGYDPNEVDKPLFRVAQDPNTSGLEWIVKKPTASLARLAGSPRGPVLSDAVSLRLNGLPPGTPVTGVRVTGSHIPQLKITGESVVFAGSVRSTGAYLHAEDRAGFTPPRRAITVDEIGVASDPNDPTGIILEADLDGDGEYEPLASAALEVDLGPQHEVSPDGNLNWDFSGGSTLGTTMKRARMTYRRAGGGPTALDLSVFGFDPVPITVSLRSAGTVVDSQTYSAPYPPGLVTGNLRSIDATGATAATVTVDVSHAHGGGGGGAGGVFITTHLPLVVAMSLSGSSMGPVSADEIEIRMATDGLPPDVPILDTIERVQISGSNLVDVGLLGSSYVLLDPDSDGDGLYPDEDCDDTDPAAWRLADRSRHLQLRQRQAHAHVESAVRSGRADRLRRLRCPALDDSGELLLGRLHRGARRLGPHGVGRHGAAYRPALLLPRAGGQRLSGNRESGERQQRNAADRTGVSLTIVH